MIQNAGQKSDCCINHCDGGDFTAREVTNLMGRRVIAREGLMVPYGTRGSITDSRRYTSGWLMHVAWDGLGDGSGDWLTKREASHSLSFTD